MHDWYVLMNRTFRAGTDSVYLASILPTETMIRVLEGKRMKTFDFGENT